MEIHLIRHTRVALSEGICYGQADCDLRDGWEADISDIQVDNDYDAVYSSPLKRCTRLADHLGLQYMTEPRLKELFFGEWEMKAWKDIPPEEIEPWYTDFINVTPPGGENLLMLQRRAVAVLKDIQARHNDSDKILIITHAGVIRIILQHIMAFPLENIFLIQPQHGRKMVLEVTGGLWKWKGMNW